MSEQWTKQVAQLREALGEACRIALEWIDLGIPDDDAQNAAFRIRVLRATGTDRRCACIHEIGDSWCEVHPTCSVCGNETDGSRTCKPCDLVEPTSSTVEVNL